MMLQRSQLRQRPAAYPGVVVLMIAAGMATLSFAHGGDRRFLSKSELHQWS